MSILKEQAVLVLGAGASQGAGFPLGPGLKELLLKSVAATRTVAALGKHGYDRETLAAFRDALRFGSHPTVDIFLERKTRFRELGSYMIASALMPLETKERLFGKTVWYRELLEGLRLGSPESGASKLSVVTLNYDRSLEHYLKMGIDYNCPDGMVELAHRQREEIEIVHAHGSLGLYPAVPYGVPVDNEGALRAASQSIRIVSDRLDESPDFAKAQKVIASAAHVVFLWLWLQRADVVCPSCRGRHRGGAVLWHRIRSERRGQARHHRVLRRPH